ncbi:MAG: TRAP transporter small permease subunit [Alphaproteobacteria bacterium]|nr:MAG: TRAP transporter small permease subunit [Alphaproteobacteria bacterium]
MTDSDGLDAGPFQFLARLALVGACVSLVALVLVEAWQVIGRYALEASPSWTEPVALVMIKFALMFGAAVGVRAEAHFRFQLLVDAVPGALHGALEAFARIICALIGAALAIWSAVMAAETWGVKVAGAPLPMGFYFVPFLVGGSLICLFALERLFLARAHTPVAE